MNRRRTIQWIALICVSTTIFAQDTVRVTALRGPTGVTVAPMIAAGQIDDPMATVLVDLVPDPPTMIARLASGDTDIGMLPSNVAAQLHNRGIPVRIAAVTLWGLLYVVGPESSGSGWGALAGDEIQAVGQGATPDILARHLLEEAGLAGNGAPRLAFQYAPVELAQLVIAGRVNAALLPEPFVTQILARRDDLAILVDLQAEWRSLYGESYPQTVIVVREDADERAPEAVAAALRMIETATNTVNADAEGLAASVTAAGLGLPPAVVVAAVPRLNAVYVPVGVARPALERYFRVLHGINPRAIGGQIPAARLYRD